MAKTYYLSGTSSDLSGGSAFSRKLLTATGTAGTITITHSGSTARDSYAWTEPGEPGAGGSSIGNFTVRANVTTASGNIYVSAALSRVNSSGVVQATTSYSAEQLAQPTGIKSFTFTDPALGTWVVGDRLRVTYRTRDYTGKSSSFVIGTGTASEAVDAPFGALYSETLSEAVAVAEGLSAANLVPVSVSESATASQTFAVALTMNVALASAATLSDAVTGGKHFASALTEALSASHGQAVTQTHASAVSEGVASAVTQAATLVASPSVAEGLTAGHSLTTNAVLSVGTTEGLTASDTVAVAFTLVGDVTEGVTAIVSLTVQVTEPNGWDKVEELVNAWSEVGGVSGQWVEINSNNGNWTLQ